MSMRDENAADVQKVEETSRDGESNQMELIAKMAAQLLSKHYANHWWMVGWSPGMTLCIKHGAGDSRYGYTVDASRAASISQLEKAIIMGGGELLERMGMKRGAWDGEQIGLEYEGVKEVT
jgi:hypothetical protein